LKQILSIVSIIIGLSAAAQLRLPFFLDSHMVLQQQKVNRIWGWADAGQLVTVSVTGKTYQSIADKTGAWAVFIAPMPAGKVGNITITAGASQKVLEDVLAGEVWICSGQSNMEWKMNMLGDTYAAEMKSASNDNIRYVTVRKSFHNQPQQDVELDNPWSSITTATIGDCSAVAYWYAKKLQQELQVPVGLVLTSWGGTPAQSWTSFEALGDFPHYSSTYVKEIATIDFSRLEEQKKLQQMEWEQNLRSLSALSNEALAPAYNDQDWKEMRLPGEWERQGYPLLDGVVLYRLWFDVPANAAGETATLYMPAIDDIDSTFVNGYFVGSISKYNEPRTYKIPGPVLKAGKNLLFIKVQDDGGGGGLADTPERFYVQTKAGSIALSGMARYKIGAEKKNAGISNLQNQPATLYNAMIAPLLPLSMRGAIWYQGESNASAAYEYRRLFPAMIEDWRNRWAQGYFPFYFVQLSSYGALRNEPGESSWAELREAQTMTLQQPNTGMAVTIDVGNPNNIHPVQKKEVGERLAWASLHDTYGKKEIEYAGPQLASWKAEGNQIILTFNHADGGLQVKGDVPKHFAIAGDDKKFVWANATVKGNSIIVSHPSIAKPAAVRYAWADSPIEANIFNKAGLPAVPFRTDNWKGITQTD
jgi:sialate O-acetylesterase